MTISIARRLRPLALALALGSAHLAQAAPPGLSRLPEAAQDAPGVAAAQASVAPSVTLTAPAEGTVVVAPADLVLTATASDARGSIERVDFYVGTTLLGNTTVAPYQYSWRAVPAGRYQFTAVATNNRRQSATSAPVAVVVNAPPVVDLTPPAALVQAPATLDLRATASDSDGTIARVDFLADGARVGSATAAPYAATWSDVPAGTYRVAAVATDDRGATTTSAAATVVVNAQPTVGLTSPAANAVVTAPGSLTLTAEAADSDDTVTRVDFYADTTLLGSATAAPYRLAWSDVAAGSYRLTAVAYDERGGVSTSAAVPVRVNAPPTVSLTSPAAGEGFTAPANVTLAASANDADGSIAQVAFYGDGTLLGTVSGAPYSLTWANLRVGSYTVTAEATDDQGAVAKSAAVMVSVAAAGTRITYLFADHLGTPRLATDSNNTVVWRSAPLIEPFGLAPPEEDPDGDGLPFTLNLRFPGQYFDRESNLAYNYFRDYDPATGRYVQSDPLGLDGGPNLYAYANNAPTMFTDPSGLYAPFWHHQFTLMGGANSCMNSSEVSQLAQEVVNVDDGTQDVWQSHMHAMCAAGLTRDQCQRNYENYLDSLSRSCDLRDLAKLIHAVQDSYSQSHAGLQSYSGLSHLPPSHLYSDNFPSPSEVRGVPIVTSNILGQWCSRCRCKKQ